MPAIDINWCFKEFSIYDHHECLKCVFGKNIHLWRSPIIHQCRSQKRLQKKDFDRFVLTASNLANVKNRGTSTRCLKHLFCFLSLRIEIHHWKQTPVLCIFLPQCVGTKKNSLSAVENILLAIFVRLDLCSENGINKIRFSCTAAEH